MLRAVFLTAILPIVSLATVGYVLGRLRNVDVGALNTVTIYVLEPSTGLFTTSHHFYGAGVRSRW
jgi:predicted permease